MTIPGSKSGKGHHEEPLQSEKLTNEVKEKGKEKYPTPGAKVTKKLK